MLFLLFTILLTTSHLSVHAMTEPITTQNESLRWAETLCTDSFLKKLQITASSMVFDNEPNFATDILANEEKTLLDLLVSHNEWSFALYQKLASINTNNPELAQENYVQIIAWAFGKKAKNFNALHDYQYAVINLNNKEHGEVLDSFIQEHPNLYMKDGKPFLFNFLKKKKSYLLSALLNCGANPDARCAESGDSVLHELGNMHFRRYSHPNDMNYYDEVITLFRKLINTRNNYGMTPLHEAVDNINLMKVILEFEDVEINAQDEGGETALHYAAHLFKADLDADDKAGKLLLKYGANGDIKSNDGLTYQDILNSKNQN